VTFQGTTAGGCIERVFAVDGIDETSTDRCEIYALEHGSHVNRKVLVPQDESMGRLRSAENFVRVLEGREEPLNTPDQAVKLMRIVDAVYASAERGKPVKLG
jgi:predicted dehydrogenase